MAIKLSDVVYGNNGIGFLNLIDRSSVLEDNVSVVDSDWIRSRFMVGGQDLDDIDRTNRFFTTAHWKFTDTTLGGNIPINVRPQYTRYADIRHGGRLKRNEVKVTSITGGHGMGRYYSEAIDDNATTIFMSFGVPRFNSIVSFFTRAIDGIDSYVARTGRLPNEALYEAGRVSGTVLTFVFFPLMASLIWLTKTVAGTLTVSDTNFNFYYLEPNMDLYWGSVNTITTILATELGIVAPLVDTMGAHDPSKAKKIGQAMQFDQEDYEYMKKIFPSIYYNGNYIDVYSIATRSQRIANLMMLKEFEDYKNARSSDSDFLGYVRTKDSTEEFRAQGSTVMDIVNYYTSFDNWIGRVTGESGFYRKEYKIVDNPAVGGSITPDTNGNVDSSAANSVAANPSQAMIMRNADGSYDIEKTQEELEYEQGILSTLDSAIRDGGMWLALNVDYQGPVSESFSNSTGEIGTKDAIKSVAKGVQDMRFNFAGGKIAQGVDEVLNATKSVIMGTLEGVTLGFSNVIATLFGGAYVDIPKKWEDSSMSMPSVTYKTRLISPYGNPLSQMQNIYIPLACILAGALPIAAGKVSYSSPFLCSLFNKGVQDIPMGMITSLSIERGVSNLGFSKNKKALAIDVSFSVTDFSTLITAPINRTIFSKAFSISLEDEKPLNKYLATVAGRDILTNKYALPKIQLALSRKLMNIQQATSPHAWTFRAGQKLNGLLGPIVNQAGMSQTQSNSLF